MTDLESIAKALHKEGYRGIAIVGIESSGSVCKIHTGALYDKEMRFVMALIEGLSSVAREIQKQHGFIPC